MKVQKTDWNMGLQLILISACLALSPSIVTAKLYKWVDSEGNVQYSDKVPAEEADKAHSVIDKSGVTVEKIDRQKTKQELQEQERKKKVAEDLAQKKEEQRQRDQILLDTFTTEDDIVMTRDGKIQALQSIINVTKGSIADSRANLESLQGQAANFEKTAKPIPKNVTDDIAKVQNSIEEYETYVQQKTKEQDELRAAYQIKFDRFRELKAIAAEQKKAAEASETGGEQ